MALEVSLVCIKSQLGEEAVELVHLTVLKMSLGREWNSVVEY